jgi:hypothetical protein
LEAGPRRGSVGHADAHAGADVTCRRATLIGRANGGTIGLAGRMSVTDDAAVCGWEYLLAVARRA